MEEFYKPSSGAGARRQELERVGELDEEPSGDQGLNTQENAPKDNVEVLNFEDLMSHEDMDDPQNEDDYLQNEGGEYQRSINGGGRHQLNEIMEENEDQASPQNPSRQRLHPQAD